jgi:ornithine cyclodeaminase/alanine dehydrogenase-like protein (mu-crystallin family)
MGREVLVLREAEVRSAIDMPTCMDAVERAFAAYSSGAAELPGVIHLDVPEGGGEVHVKAGHLHGEPFYAAKFASGFSDPSLGTPAIDGMVVVFDASNGAPAALLLDNGYLTDLRTGAAGGVAARWLAPQRVEVVAVIGTGGQVRHQLDALAVARPGYSEVRIWGRNVDHVAASVEKLRAQPGVTEGARFEAAETVRAAVDEADVVITCTASRDPLVRAAWLAPGAHVTALGSDGVGKQELDPDVLGRADVVAVDSRDQCARLGELQHALAAGVIGDPGTDVVELGEIASGRAGGRTGEGQRTVCDLTGVGVQDVAAAIVVMDAAAREGLGERIAI